VPDGCIDIIFVTAFNEYAVKAFEVNAMDYILKPVDNDRLKKSVARLLTPRRTDTGSKNSILDKIDHVEKYFKMNSEKLVAIDSDEIIMVKTSDIFYLEAQLKEIIIMTRHGKYVSRENLSQWEEKLKDYGFFRCHRSYIVNIKHINKISPMFNNNYIIKQEGTPLEIPISRNHVRELKDLLGV
jgi:DNA-binding LytR/AlgR family response regulator